MFILFFWQLNQQFRGDVVGISWWQYFISFQNNAGHNVWCLLLGESVALQGPLAARCLYSQWFGTGNLVQVLMVQKNVWFCCSPVCELDGSVAFTSATQGWNVINIHKLVRIVDSLKYSSKKVSELDKGTIARGSVWLRPPLKKKCSSYMATKKGNCLCVGDFVSSLICRKRRLSQESAAPDHPTIFLISFQLTKRKTISVPSNGRQNPNSSNIHNFRGPRGDQQRDEGCGGLSARGGEDDQLLGCDPGATIVFCFVCVYCFYT